ncbi:MAG TPA: hypothetical protein ENH40_05390, partial [Nitrospirae bacterium]|nr:hypothetical protein [Nitrospirota bacterium]
MEIDKATVEQFSTNFKLKAQQLESILESTVDVETGVVGVSHRVDLIGSSEAEDVIMRGSPLGSREMEHVGRYADLTDAEWWEFIYNFDKAKMLGDPTSKYLLAGVAAMNRKKDLRIINALGGSARQVKEDRTSESIALPAAQTIVHGSAGLTRAKLVTALEILGLEDVDLEAALDQVTLVCTQRQVSDVLNDDKLTSADYNTVRLMMDGKIDYFMGAKWKKSN